MSEYNPFGDSMPGKGLNEINNAPKESAAPATATSEDPPYVPPPNPPYEPYIPPQAVQQPYQPTQAPQGLTPPPGSSIHYAAGQNAYAGAPAARYDLAGNPLPPEPMAAAPQASYAPPPSPYGAPQQPYGSPSGAPGYGGAPQQSPYGAPQAPYGAPQGAWPPPPGQTGSALFDMQEQNTSGQQGTVPPEIERLHWNWGAYFLPVLWCRWHGMTGLAAVLSGTALILRVLRYMPTPMLPVIGAVYSLFWLAVSVYMGFNGHKMGWRNRRYFGGVEEHLKVQRAWLIGGVIAGPVVSITLGVLAITLLASSAPSGAYSNSGSTYNSPAGGNSSIDGSSTTGFNNNGAPQPGNSPQPNFNGPSSAAPPAGATTD